MAKRNASVKKEICVACGACQNVCPREAVTVWKGCYAKINLEKCIGCGLCAQICPASAVIMQKKEAAL